MYVITFYYYLLLFRYDPRGESGVMYFLQRVPLLIEDEKLTVMLRFLTKKSNVELNQGPTCYPECC